MSAATSTRRPGSSEPAISRASWEPTPRLALDVIGDILTDSQFDAGELEREKNVIVQEIGAVEDTPEDLVFDLLSATAWPDQPIGRPILGTREGVSAFDREAIDRYLREALQRRRHGGRRRRRDRTRRCRWARSIPP